MEVSGLVVKNFSSKLSMTATALLISKNYWCQENQKSFNITVSEAEVLCNVRSKINWDQMEELFT